MTARREGDELVLPGIASAHSHAFQRALRALTQRGGRGSFWSWRARMYALAEKLDPDTIHALSRFAFVELALAGVTAVGEFHYVHHGPGGAPYADRAELAHAVIRAAREAGLRICLLRVLYQRGGYGRALEGAQVRFADSDPAAALADVDAIAARWKHDPCVRVGVAPHSVRAVTLEGIRDAALHCRARGWPLHAHVAEQRREVRECLAEHGVRPVRLFESAGALDDRFVAVHATHLDEGEARALGAARAFACVCRTTERDLGDGTPDVASFLASGARLCLGADSHAISDPFEEARAVELDARTRSEGRHAAADAETLLRAATREGYAALGMAGVETEDEVRLDARDPALVGPGAPADLAVWGGSPRAVRRVAVAGRAIVEDGQHPLLPEARSAYLTALGRLGIS